jgi:hypothetical protein
MLSRGVGPLRKTMVAEHCDRRDWPMRAVAFFPCPALGAPTIFSRLTSKIVNLAYRYVEKIGYKAIMSSDKNKTACSY